MEWIGGSRGRALIGQRRASRRGVAVLHPAVKISWCEAANIRRQIRLRADQFAEPHEFVGPEPVGFIFVIGRAGCDSTPAQKFVRRGRLSAGPMPSRQS